MAINRSAVAPARWSQGSTDPVNTTLTGCTAGRGGLFWVAWDSTATLAVTITGETVKAGLASAFVANGTTRIQPFYVEAWASSGDKVITFDWSASPVGSGGICFEYDSPLYLETSNTGVAGPSGTSKSVNLTTLGAGRLLVAATAEGVNDTNFSALAGFTNLLNSGPNWYSNGGLSSYSIGAEKADSGAQGTYAVGISGPDGVSVGVVALAFRNTALAGSATRPKVYTPPRQLGIRR